MGYNTTVVVMNDSLSTIRDDPEFGRRLYEASLRVHEGKPVDVSAHGPRCICVNAATVVETHHADSDYLVLIGGNRGEVVSRYARAIGWITAEGRLRKGCPPAGEPAGWKAIYAAD